MRYALQVWSQNKNETFKETEKLQNKAIRIICFKLKLEPTKPLYRFKNSQNKISTNT